MFIPPHSNIILMRPLPLPPSTFYRSPIIDSYPNSHALSSSRSVRPLPALPCPLHEAECSESAQNPESHLRQDVAGAFNDYATRRAFIPTSFCSGHPIESTPIIEGEGATRVAPKRTTLELSVEFKRPQSLPSSPIYPLHGASPISTVTPSSAPLKPLSHDSCEIHLSLYSTKKEGSAPLASRVGERKDPSRSSNNHIIRRLRHTASNPLIENKTKDSNTSPPVGKMSMNRSSVHPGRAHNVEKDDLSSVHLLLRSLKRTGKSIPFVRSFLRDMDASPEVDRAVNPACNFWLQEKNGKRWEQRNRDTVLTELRKLR